MSEFNYDSNIKSLLDSLTNPNLYYASNNFQCEYYLKEDYLKIKSSFSSYLKQKNIAFFWKRKTLYFLDMSIRLSFVHKSLLHLYAVYPPESQSEN